MNDDQQERLYLLIEECSEVIKEATKILRFGYEDCHPITKVNNRLRLEEEIGDLEIIIDLMHGAADISYGRIAKHRPTKYNSLKIYTKYQF